MKNKIRLGTRGSALALRQTDLVQEALLKAYPDLVCEQVPFHTRGDKILDKPLWEIGSKGLFATEFETMILRGEIDAAVHSGKDLPLKLAEGLSILGVLKRADPRDVLVMPPGGKESALRVIGTGSLRRQQFASEVFPQAECRLIRGNVYTRLDKMMAGEYDGIILAKAGLDRLGIREEDGYAFRILETDEFLPAACQGIIVTEGPPEWAEVIGKTNDEETAILFETERAVLTMLQADCSEPAAAFAEKDGDFIRLRVMYGKKRAECRGRVNDRLLVAEEAVRRLL